MKLEEAPGSTNISRQRCPPTLPCTIMRSLVSCSSVDKLPVIDATRDFSRVFFFRARDRDKLFPLCRASSSELFPPPMAVGSEKSPSSALTPVSLLTWGPVDCSRLAEVGAEGEEIGEE